MRKREDPQTFHNQIRDGSIDPPINRNWSHMRTVIIVGCCLGLLGCGGSASETGLLDLPVDAQAISLFGDTLYPPTQPAEVRQFDINFEVQH